MKYSGHSGPKHKAFHEVVRACELESKWRVALRIVHHSKRPPSTVLITSAVAACGRSSQWQHALALLAGMPRQKQSSRVHHGVDLVKASYPKKLSRQQATITARIITRNASTKELARRNSFHNIYKTVTLQSKLLIMFSCKQGHNSGKNIAKKIIWWNDDFVIATKMITK